MCVCLFVRLFVRLRISPAKIKLEASNFAGWFMGVLNRESFILENLYYFAPQHCSPQSDESARGGIEVLPIDASSVHVFTDDALFVITSSSTCPRHLWIRYTAAPLTKTNALAFVCFYVCLFVSDFGDQLAEFDDRLSSRISCNPQYVLYRLLPPPSVASQNYDLRPRRHDRQLPCSSCWSSYRPRICYSHFVQTLLLAFLHYFTCVLLFHLLSVYGGMCVLSLLNKDTMMMMYGY